MNLNSLMRIELTTTSQSEFILIDINIYIYIYIYIYILSKLTVTGRRLLTLGKYYLISHLLIHNFPSTPSNLRTFEMTLTCMNVRYTFITYYEERVY